MRGLIYSLSIVSVVLLAYWANNEGYQTRQTAQEVARLQAELGRAHEELSVLRAEWAYLNRPDRLAVLHAMNFERLQLMEITAEQFGTVTQVGYPPAPRPAPFPDLMAQVTPGSTVEVQGQLPRATLIQPEPHTAEPELIP